MSSTPPSWSLHASYEEILGAMDTLNAGLIVRTPHGRLLYANDRVLEWVGYTAEELDGQDFRMLTAPELRDATTAELEEILSGDERARITIIRRRDGRTFPIVACPHVLRKEGENHVVIGLLFDIGELKTAKRVGDVPPDGLAANLERIALELQTISLFSGAAAPTSVLHNHPELEQLSVREREILAELISGKRVPAIAKDLFISPHTVRNHLKSMYRKLDLSSQAELIEFVRGLGKN
jgi:PAS domain S-box-containing protein